MTLTEKNMFRVLLFLDSVAVIIGMVAGPLGRNTLSTAASVSAIIISLCLIFYGLYFWITKKRR